MGPAVFHRPIEFAEIQKEVLLRDLKILENFLAGSFAGLNGTFHETLILDGRMLAAEVDVHFLCSGCAHEAGVTADRPIGIGTLVPQASGPVRLDRVAGKGR